MSNEYGFADWCYAIIGHMDSCNENENLCSCGHSGEKSNWHTNMVDGCFYIKRYLSGLRV